MRGPIALLLGLALLLVVVPSASAERAFSKRFSANDQGSIQYVGNTLSTCTGAALSGSISCAQAQAGAAGNNNNFNNAAVNVANLPAPNANSSSARFALPTDAQVLWAGLYWSAESTTGRSQIQLRTPASGTFTPLTSTQTDEAGVANRNYYQSFVEVTDLVRNAGGGVYTAGGIGMDTGLGDRFGGWTLVIVLKDATQPPRNLTVFDGFQGVADNAAQRTRTINVNGFTTPPSGPVRTRIGVVASEGDRGSTGDRATLDGRPLTNGANPSTNFFNSTLTTEGARRSGLAPDYDNTLGYDADILGVDGFLENRATSASIGLTTGGETYAPGVVTFSTELYAPRLTATKAVQNLTRTSGPTRRGDRLRYTVAYANGGGDDAAGLRIEDRLPAGTTYVPNSIRVTGGPGAGTAPSDAAGDDAGEILDGGRLVRVRSGSGATASAGGTLAVGQESRITFDVTVDGDVPDDTSIDNVAAASFRSEATGTPFADLPSPTASVRVREPDLAIAKTHQGAILAGAPVRFALSVTNVGGASSSGPVTVTDTLDAGTFVRADAADGAGWDCTVSGRDVSCTRSDALAGEAGYPPIYVDATAANALPATVQNVATVAGGGDTNAANNSGTDVGAGTNRADLRTENAFDQATATAGDLVTWTMRVVNDGPSPAVNARITDPVPAGLTVVGTPISTRGTCTAAASVFCAFGSLAPGESAVVTVTARVGGSPRTVTNTATAATDTPDPNAGNDAATGTLDVLPSADLRIAMTSPAGTGDANVPYSWTMVVTNGGPDTAQGVEVLDGLPENFENASAVASGGAACAVANGRMRCTLASLASGDSFTVTLTGSSPTGGLVSNSAAVRSTTVDPDPGDNSSSAAFVVAPAADLVVNASFGALTNGQSTVTLASRNDGPSAATGVDITTTLPASLTFVSGNGCTYDAPTRVVTCPVGNVASGAAAPDRTFAVAPAANGSGVVTLTALVDGDQEDPYPGSNRSEARLTLPGGADLALTQTVSSPDAAVADQLTWTLGVVNNGPGDAATNVVLVDTLPEGVEDVATTTPGCTVTGRTLRCEFASLAAAATQSVTVTGTVGRGLAGGSLTNAASVSSDTPERAPGNETATTTASIARRVELALAKTVRQTTVGPDRAVTYDLTVTNGGPNAARDVALVDTVPGGMAVVETDPGCAVQAGVVRCTVGLVPSGGSATRSVTLRPGRGAAGTTLTNQLNATTSDPGPTPAQATRQLNVAPQVDLTLVKTATPTRVTAGNEAVLTYDLSNRGPSDATGVLLEDALPAGLQVVGVTTTQGTCVSGPPVRCTLGTLQSGGSAQVIVRVRPTAGGTYASTAAATSTEGEATPQDNSSRASLAADAAPGAPGTPGSPGTGTPSAPGAPAPGGSGGSAAPAGSPRLVVDKRRLTRSLRVGRPISYRITVRNAGDATARDVRVSDVPSRRVRVLGLGSSRGPCASRDPIRCDVGDLAPGETATVSVRLAADSAGELRNSATALGAGPAAASVAGDRDTGTVRSSPNTIALRLVPDRRTVRGGSRVRFRLVVPNRARSTLRSVRVCATLPRGFTYARRGSLRLNGRRGCVTIPRLGGRATRTFRFEARASVRSRSATLRPSATARAAGRRSARDDARLRVLGGRVGSGADGGVTG